MAPMDEEKLQRSSGTIVSAWLRAFVSAVTLVGGHFMNRRLDRVVLVLAGLGLWVVFFYVAWPSLVFQFEEVWPPPGGSFFRVPVMALLALLVGSSLLTWLDARRGEENLRLSVVTRIAGGVLSVVGFAVIGFAVLLLSLMRGPVSLPSASSSSVAESPSYEYESPAFDNFHASVNLGGGVSSFDLPPPPAGEHMLRGKITLDNQPASGAHLYLLLNSQYKTAVVETDGRGEFEIGLPAGTWRVNHVSVDAWPSRPRNRSLLLFSGQEPTRSEHSYDLYPSGPGVAVELPRAGDAAALTLELRDSIDLEWPAGFHDPSDAAAATDAIRWRPVNGAQDYEVQISSVTREGPRSSTYHPILDRRVSDTTLPLADLPYDNDDDDVEPGEYTVRVLAFDQQGRLLTTSDGFFGTYAFKLTDGRRLKDERTPGFSKTGAPGRSSAYIENVERLSVANGLMEDGRYDAAAMLLDEVTTDAPPGRVAALKGYLAARQGDCDRALPLFEQAEREGGPSCAPLEHRRLCAPQ